MKVLLVNKFAHLTGGADQHCFALAQALREQGHEVRFLSTYSPRNVETDGAFVRCTVTNATRDALPLQSRLGVALRAAWNREAAAAMKRLLEDFQPDVVHAHKLYPQLSVAPLMVAHRSGFPIIQTVHDHEFTAANAFDEFHRRIDRIETRLSYRVLNTATLPVRHAVHARLVDTWIAVSTYIGDTLVLPGISAVVLRNFVDPVDPRSLPSYEERSGAVFIGRLRPEKGVHDVLEVARRLPTMPVTIAGDGELASTVREEAARLPNLRYDGFVSRGEVGALLARSRISVIPSRWNEGGPLSALEAMAHGVVPVVYPAGGLGEYVQGAGGAVVDADPGALAEAVMRLHEDRSSWNNVSRSVLAAVAREHTPSRYLEQLLPIYEAATVRAQRVSRRWVRAREEA